jgi:HSP20 family molecular chaperone IbpA
MTIDAMINNFYNELENSYSLRKQTYNKLSEYKLFEKSDNIVFKCLAPGMSKEDIDISFDKKRLIIKSTDSSGDTDFNAKFNDSISLYKSIDADRSFASLNKGILTVTMPINKAETKKKILFR